MIHGLAQNRRTLNAVAVVVVMAPDAVAVFRQLDVLCAIHKKSFTSHMKNKLFFFARNNLIIFTILFL